MNDNQYTENLEAFGEPFQQVIVGHCLSDQSFLVKCRAMVQKEWFTNIICAELIGLIYDIYESKRSYNSVSLIPTRTELNIELAKFYPNMKDRTERMNMLDRCIGTAKDTDIDFVRERMTGWIQMITMKRMIEAGAAQFKKKQFDKCRDWIAEKIVEIKKTTFMEDNRESFKNAFEMFRTRAQSLLENCVTFGHPDMDELLCEGSKKPNVNANSRDINEMTRGGLLPGDTTVLMGTTNSGKTTTVITIIVMNVLMGKHVLFFTHEQVAADIKSKIISSLLGVSMFDIQQAATYTQEQIDKMPPDALLRYQKLVMGMQWAENRVETYLHYVHWTKYGKMYVEDVMDEVQKLQDEKVAERAKAKELGGEGRTDLRGYDLFVNDYPAKLRSRQAGQAKQWDMLAYIYDQFVLAAERNKFHSILTVQTNRSGYQINRGDTEDARSLDIDDVAGAYGIMTIASNVITLNRSEWDKANSTIRYFIPKCRSAATGTTFIAKSNFGLNRAFQVGEVVSVLQGGKKLSNSELLIAMGLESNEDKARRMHMEGIKSGQVPVNPFGNVVQSSQNPPVSDLSQNPAPAPQGTQNGPQQT